MTIELAVAFPVLIVVALIAFNAMEFFSLCALFDRSFADEVRMVAASPAAGNTASGSCSEIEAKLQRYFEALPSGVTFVELEVSHSSAPFDLDEFTAVMDYHPTFFGMGMRDEIWGVRLPTLSHSTSVVVDCYKPGVVL